MKRENRHVYYTAVNKRTSNSKKGLCNFGKEDMT